MEDTVQTARDELIGAIRDATTIADDAEREQLVARVTAAIAGRALTSG